MEDMVTNSKLYMCVESDENCIWQVLDIYTHELLQDETDQMNNSPLKTPLKNGSVVLGTKIYVIGGSSCQIFDTATQRWALGAEMDVEMHNPLLVPVPSMNMLFVFSGIEESFCARVYDIGQNEWQPIQNPKWPITKNLTGYFFFGGILVLWNQHVFCTFLVEEKKWKDQIKVKNYFPGEKSCGIVPRALLLKNCWLFWFSGKELMSFNLSTDETLHFFLDPKEAKRISHYFQSVTSSFLVSCSDEKLCLIWLNNEPEGTKRWHCCTFTLSSLPDDVVQGQGPFLLQLDDSPVEDFLPGNARLHHCLTMQQPSEGLNKEFSSWYSIHIRRSVRVILNDLSRRMYLENYLSFLRNMERKDAPAAKPVHGYCPEVEISIDHLMSGLGLDENCRYILNRIIDTDALQLLTEDEVKKLNIPVDHDSLKRPNQEPPQDFGNEHLHESSTKRFKSEAKGCIYGPV